MKRYLYLIRYILEYAEGKESGAFSHAPECSKHSWEELHYHIGLCGEAGFLRVKKVSAADEAHPRYEVGSLTWEGHEALDRLRATGNLRG